MNFLGWLFAMDWAPKAWKESKLRGWSIFPWSIESQWTKSTKGMLTLFFHLLLTDVLSNFWSFFYNVRALFIFNLENAAVVKAYSFLSSFRKFISFCIFIYLRLISCVCFAGSKTPKAAQCTGFPILPYTFVWASWPRNPVFPKVNWI